MVVVEVNVHHAGMLLPLAILLRGGFPSGSGTHNLHLQLCLALFPVVVVVVVAKDRRDATIDHAPADFMVLGVGRESRAGVHTPVALRVVLKEKRNMNGLYLLKLLVHKLYGSNYHRSERGIYADIVHI